MEWTTAKIMYLSFSMGLICFARAMWHAGTAFYCDGQIRMRLHAIEVLEREIVAQRFKCAATNPEAAEILAAQERRRQGRYKPSDWDAYRRFYDPDLGGELREQPLSEAEADAERLEHQGSSPKPYEPPPVPPQEPPCGTAAQS